MKTNTVIILLLTILILSCAGINQVDRNFSQSKAQQPNELTSKPSNFFQLKVPFKFYKTYKNLGVLKERKYWEKIKSGEYVEILEFVDELYIKVKYNKKIGYLLEVPYYFVEEQRYIDFRKKQQENMYEISVSSRLYTEPKFGNHTLTANKSDWVEVLENTSTEFVKVKFKNQVGYMLKVYFHKTEEWINYCNKLFNELKDYQEKIEKTPRWIKSDNVNFRKQATTDSEVLYSFQQGDKIFVQDRNEEWLKALYLMTSYSLKAEKDTVGVLSNYYTGWVYEPLTATYLVPKILQQERDWIAKKKKAKQQQQQIQKSTNKKDSKLQILYDSGLLKKFNIDLNEAWVEPYIWYSIDYDVKLGIGITLAKICDNAGSTGYITFFNNKSGKKLARYSQSWGYKSYE